jgi:hypothetical protein
MTIAVQVRTDEVAWKVLGASTVVWKRSYTHAVVPEAEEEQVLLKRLIVRSTASNGFDRATLLRLDSEAWGAAED